MAGTKDKKPGTSKAGKQTTPPTSPSVVPSSPSAPASPVLVKPRKKTSRPGKKPNYFSDQPRESTIHKEKLFVRRYLVDMSPTKAVLECGAWHFKSEQAASSFSAKLMKRPRVKMAIADAMEKRGRKFDLQADDVLLELKKLGMSNMMDYVRLTPDGGAVLDLTDVNREQMAAVQEITSEVYVDKAAQPLDDDDDAPPLVKKTRLKLYDKRGPLELLGKHLGAFLDPPAPPSRLNVRIKVVYEDRPKSVIDAGAADFIDAEG